MAVSGNRSAHSVPPVTLLPLIRERQEDDLGWGDSVSTSAWATSIGRYYDEMAAPP